MLSEDLYRDWQAYMEQVAPRAPALRSGEVVGMLFASDQVELDIVRGQLRVAAWGPSWIELSGVVQSDFDWIVIVNRGSREHLQIVFGRGSPFAGTPSPHLPQRDGVLLIAPLVTPDARPLRRPRPQLTLIHGGRA